MLVEAGASTDGLLWTLRLRDRLRFHDGTPAPRRAGLTSGAKVVHVDRVEWVICPSPRAPRPDLLPLLRRDKRLTVSVNDKTGVVPILRFNTLHAPLDNIAIPRAVLSAVQQKDLVEVFSSEPDNYRTGVGIFCPGTPSPRMSAWRNAGHRHDRSVRKA